MKNLFILLVAFFAINSFVINAQDSYSKAQENYRKEAQKEAKKTAKELKKNKWTYSGAMTLEGSLTDYYLKCENFGGKYEGRFYTINNASNLRNGELQLLTTAQNEYAQENEAVLMGKVSDHSGLEETTIRNSVVKMSAMLKGDVKKAFILYKRNANDTYDMGGYFLIDINSAEKKIEQLAKEIEMSDMIENSAIGDK